MQLRPLKVKSGILGRLLDCLRDNLNVSKQRLMGEAARDRKQESEKKSEPRASKGRVREGVSRIVGRDRHAFFPWLGMVSQILHSGQLKIRCYSGSLVGRQRPYYGGRKVRESQ